MSITVTLDTKGLDRLIREAPGELDKEIRRAGFRVEGRAKVKAPIDTGFLRASIQTTTPETFAADVSVGAEYGVFVEFGTVNQSAQPFLTPAVEEERPVLDKRLAALIKKLGDG